MPKQHRRWVGILKISVIVLLLLVIAVIVLPFVIDANQFRPKLESELSSALGRDVKVGDLRLTILSGSIAANDITIADDPDFSRSPFITAKSLQVGVELKPLILSRGVRVRGITLEGPEIRLIRSTSGRWNFSTIHQAASHGRKEAATAGMAGSAPGDVSIGFLEISDGRLVIIGGNDRGPQHVYDNVYITARNLSADAPFPFTLTAKLPGGGSVDLEGNAGPLDRTDASLTPFSASLKLAGLDSAASGLLPPETGLAGVLDFTGTLSSNGHHLQSTGEAKAMKARFVKNGTPASEPVSLRYTVSHDLRNQTGTVSGTEVDIGRAVAHLDGTYEIRGGTTILNIRLHGKDMPAADLASMLPPLGVTLPRDSSLQSGALNIDGAAEGPSTQLVSTGTVELSKARLDGFDFGGKLAAVTRLTGIQSSQFTNIEKFRASFRQGPDGIRIDNLVLILPALGEIEGAGTVGVDKSLDFKMVAKLTTSQGALGAVSRLAGLKTGKEIDAPFFIRGTTTDPSFVPDTKGVAKGLLESLKGKSDRPGEDQSGKTLGDTLRDLFGKKKPPSE